MIFLNSKSMFPFRTHVLVFWFFAAVFCVLGTAASSTATNAAASQGWVQIFDGKSFGGWYPKIQNHPQGEDPAKIFQIDDGVIHTYKDQAEGDAVPSGYLATEAEYSAYRLRLEYKWGGKRFRPRAMQRRDAGLLYHVVGPDIVWPRCLECQIQENDVGDCFTVRGAQVAISGELVDPVKRIVRYKAQAEGGTPQTVGDGSICHVVKSETNEHDGWNIVELVVHGSDGSQHVVNGKTVFESNALRQLGPADQATQGEAKGAAEKTWQPLARGKIALQAEYAEVLYRNIEIQEIADESRDEKRK
jgi:hypothetical protein